MGVLWCVIRLKLLLFLQRMINRCLSLVNNVPLRCVHSSAVRTAKRWKDKTIQKYTKDFINPVKEVAGMKAPNPEKGIPYDNKPFKVRVEQHCKYLWCGCGLARTQQPFCDLSCQNLFMEKLVKTGPVEYIAPETKDIWLCNCKQTENRPFCDGSHRTDDIQEHRFDGPRQLWEPRDEKRPK